MADKKLSSQELFTISQMIIEIVSISRVRRLILHQSGKITLAELLNISTAESTLLGDATELSNQFINGIVTDLESPGDRIKIATKKAQDSINKIENFQNFIGILGSVIELLGQIVTAAPSVIIGQVPFAAIASGVDKFENLLKQL
ncbi:MAG: hypothetical protein KME31_19470 [Tolypothrix carrinoi HA7290-LM1]|jgi:hypothetical protein|nr:hypothetical protein [Tolypothrix carrinoi HA7290-LM1]